MDELSSLTIGDHNSKLSIFNALDALMQHTPFDKITVTQICTEAHISRATFYRNFKDKFAIPQWHLNYAHARGTVQIGRTLTWQAGYYLTEAAIAERRDFYANVARSHDYNAVDNYAPRMRKKDLITTITDYHRIPLTNHLRFLVDATVEIEVHLLPKWHYGSYDVPLAEICSWMADAVPRELFDLLNTPAKPPGAGAPPVMHR